MRHRASLPACPFAAHQDCHRRHRNPIFATMLTCALSPSFAFDTAADNPPVPYRLKRLTIILTMTVAGSIVDYGAVKLSEVGASLSSSLNMPVSDIDIKAAAASVLLTITLIAHEEQRRPLRPRLLR